MTSTRPLRREYAGSGLAIAIFVGRIKGCRAAVGRCDPERILRVEDALIWRGMGDLRDTHPRSVLAR